MNDTQFPAWYESTSGPGLSQTLISITGNVIPILNMLLASKGINILPESINPWISIGVFLFFSIHAAMSYIRAKQVLGARILSLSMQTQQSKRV